jgi:mevalonate kinase
MNGHTPINGHSTPNGHTSSPHLQDSSSDDSDASSEVDCAASIISTGTKLKYKILDSLEVKLENEGFEKFETTLAGDGVGILWPAVLHNGNEEEGGEEIDQDKFMNAAGTTGIERLVGVASSRRKNDREVREGWKFWRPWELPEV